jgi:nitroreductase
MKTRSFTGLILFFVFSVSFGQQQGNCVTDNILSAFSERTYTTTQVTAQQIDLILKCGIKAPSARNNQPWRFTVIKEEAAMNEIIKDVLPGNVLIIISGTESQSGTTPDFDCGLATENMFIAAHGLGLGARIYGSPVAAVNSKKEFFQIPAGFKAVIVLRVGNVEKQVDAVSAATPRKKVEEVVNYMK